MDLCIKYKTIKLLGKKNTGENLCDLDLGKEFLDFTPKAQSIKGKIDKFDIKFIFIEQS